MIDLARCKQLLPLPSLMERLGYGDNAKVKARCPWHEDKTASFSVFETDGKHFYKCHAGCGEGDEVSFIAKALALSKGDAIRRYADLAGVNNGATPIAPVISPLTDNQINKLAEWRGYSVEFVKGLSERGVIGTYTDRDGKACIAFPVTDGAHYRVKDGSWRYSPGAKAELFVLGQFEEGAHVHCFESQWDALAYADASGELNNVVATRGAGNAKLAAQRLTGHTGTIYIWPQNDEPGQKWARNIRELLPNEQIKLVTTPQEHKDLNAWRKAGATDGAVFNAFLAAKDFTGGCLASTGGALAQSNVEGSNPSPGSNFPVPVLADRPERIHLIESPEIVRKDTDSQTTLDEARESIESLESLTGDSRGGENTLSGSKDRPVGKSDPEKVELEARTSSVIALPAQSLALVLDSIGAFLRKYMRFEDAWQCDICCLWAAYTWNFRSFARTPYLYIFSPEANCGKTQLMTCLYYLAPPEPRRWSIVAPSEASLFRKIHKDTPVIFVDEIDIYFAKGYDDPIVGILNAGYKIGARVPRCIGRTGELEEFEVFCPKCFTGIGKLPTTTASRSIHIRLTRQASDDMAQSFREMEIPNEVKEITSFLADWAKIHAKGLQAARPLIPDEIKDGRKIEIIEPLLAIADLAGEEWADRARHAAVSAFDQNLEAQSEKTKLLASMRSLFLTKSAERLTTIEILTGLVAMEDADAPWPTWWEKDLAQNRTRGPAMKLATMLKSFGIHPRTIRPTHDDDPAKGYVRADFELAWKRYLTSQTQYVETPLGL